MTTKKPLPVVSCDFCRRVAPLRVENVDGTSVAGQERLDDLAADGWSLTATRDLCPNCAPHEAVNR